MNYLIYFEIYSKIYCEGPYEEYKLDEFVIIQCPKGKISFGEGKIKKIKDEFISLKEINEKQKNMLDFEIKKNEEFENINV